MKFVFDIPDSEVSSVLRALEQAVSNPVNVADANVLVGLYAAMVNIAQACTPVEDAFTNDSLQYVHNTKMQDLLVGDTTSHFNPTPVLYSASFLSGVFSQAHHEVQPEHSWDQDMGDSGDASLEQSQHKTGKQDLHVTNAESQPCMAVAESHLTTRTCPLVGCSLHPDHAIDHDMLQDQHNPTCYQDIGDCEEDMHQHSDVDTGILFTCDNVVQEPYPQPPPQASPRRSPHKTINNSLAISTVDDGRSVPGTHPPPKPSLCSRKASRKAKKTTFYDNFGDSDGEEVVITSKGSCSKGSAKRRQYTKNPHKNITWISTAPPPPFTAPAERALLRLCTINTEANQIHIHTLIGRICSEATPLLATGNSFQAIVSRVKSLEQAASYLDFYRIADYIKFAIHIDMYVPLCCMAMQLVKG